MLFLLTLSLLCFQDARVVGTVSLKHPAEKAADQKTSAQDRHAALLAGMRRRGVEVEFTGGEVFPSEELLKMLSEDEHAAGYFEDGVAAEKFEQGDESFGKLDYALKLLRNRLASRGYLQAKIGEPRLERLAFGRRIVIPASEGTLYRMGEIKFDGAKLFSAEELSKRFPLKAGEVASGEAIYSFLFEQLKKEYADRGYIQYSADAEPTFHAPQPGTREGVVDYLLTIEEGGRFLVDTVEFVGNVSAHDSVIRPALRLRQGQPFSHKLLEESLKNLQALGLFARIDFDRDVNFATDEENSRVRVKIRLTEKNQP